MPVSITVSHLPSSCSFYLSILQPLGYRFINHQDSGVGLGKDQANFLLRQENSENKRKSVHITFLAESEEAVDHFFSAAIRAGGRIEERPSYCKDLTTYYYSSSVADLDGNIAECLCRKEPEFTCDQSLSSACAQRINIRAGVLSEIEVTSIRISVREFGVISQPEPSFFPNSGVISNFGLDSKHNIATSVVKDNNSLSSSSSSSTTSSSRQGSSSSSSLSDTSKSSIGTILGAATGAALLYALSKAEDSPQGDQLERAPETPEGYKTRSTIEKIAKTASDIGLLKSSLESHLGQDTTPNQDAMSTHSRTTIRAIEPPPSLTLAHRPKSHISTSRASLAGSRSVTYPAPPSQYSSIAPTSHVSASSRQSRRQSIGPVILPPQREYSLPQSPRDLALSPIKRGSQVTVSIRSPPETVVVPRRSDGRSPPSAFTKYTTETFVFSPTRRDSLPSSSGYSEASSRSRRPITLAPSEASYRSGRSRRTEEIPLPPSTRGSVVSRRMSLSGSSVSTIRPAGDTRAERPFLDFDDNESLAPSDSISQVSSRSRRSRRSSGSRRSHR